MRIVSIIFLFLLTTSGFSIAADDPGGWRGVKWGMTRAEVLKANPSASEGVTNGGEKIISAENEIIQDVKFHVTYRFSNAELLYQVGLSSDIKGSKKTEVATFKQLLTEKYGTPNFSNKDTTRRGDFDEITSWIVGNTKIELRYFTISRIDFHSLQIIYSLNTIKTDL